MVEMLFLAQRRTNKYICIQNQILELIMKHKSLSLLALSLLAGSVYAQGISYNVGVVNNYLYRGISQTRGEPAVQGGVDYAHKSGVYVGAWASSIKWIDDYSYTVAGNGTREAFVTGGSTELDLYGGYKFDLAPGMNLDLGYLRYEYLGNSLKNNPAYGNANTDEIYLGLNTSMVNIKFSYALSNLFGQLTATGGDAKGATYTEFSREFDLGAGYKLTPKLGMTSNTKITNASYNDYALTLTKELQEGLVLSVGYSGTSANRNYYYSNFNNKFLGDQSAVVGLKYNF